MTWGQTPPGDDLGFGVTANAGRIRVTSGDTVIGLSSSIYPSYQKSEKFQYVTQGGIPIQLYIRYSLHGTYRSMGLFSLEMPKRRFRFFLFLFYLQKHP